MAFLIAPVCILIVLIALKTIIDVKFHPRQHKVVVSTRKPVLAQERSDD